MNTGDLIHNLLDENIGFANNNDFNDYENKEAIIEYAIELVGANDNLTCGCGVGPLMHYIKQWVDDFEQKTLSKK